MLMMTTKSKRIEGFHGNDVGDLDAYIAQKDMDRDLPFRRQYAYDSDDEGPVE